MLSTVLLYTKMKAFVLSKIEVTSKLSQKFVGDIFIFANGRMFTTDGTQLGRRTDGQTKSQTCLGTFQI